MANFEIALAKTLKFEGGYSNNPNDAGGETFCGISRKWHPDWIGWKIVDEIIRIGRDPSKYTSPELEAYTTSFYRTNFWVPLRADEIESQEIANYLFDFAVNSGISDAVKALQKACNGQGSGLKVDGVIGNKTISVLNGSDFQHEIHNRFVEHRLFHYCKCIAKDVDNLGFAMGWIKRALNA